jgi:hypothetical protein
MRRSLARTILGLVLAAAFVVGRAEEAVGALHCPHHDAVPGGVEPAAGDGSAGTDRSHHDHREAAPDPGEAQPSHTPGGEHGVCTCMGECQSPSGVSLPTPSIAVVLLRLPQQPARAPADAPLPPRVAQPHTIPYAQAPPPLC